MNVVSSSRKRTAMVVSTVLAVVLIAAYLLKSACAPEPSGFWRTTSYCYTDLVALWSQRGFSASVLPYSVGVAPGVIEYPPGLAFPAWLISTVTGSAASFLAVHAVTFAVAAYVTLWTLFRGLRRLEHPIWRVYMFVASPTLLLVGMQNWDLWVVGAVSIGLLAAVKGRTGLAAVWFAVAAAIKWWPVLLVVPIAVGPWARSPTRTIAGRQLDPRPVGVFIVTWVALQIPAVLISVDGWVASWAFHLARDANVDSTMGLILRVVRATMGPSAAATTSLVMSVVTILAVLIAVELLSRRLHQRLMHPTDAGLVLVAVFLLVSKILSPQFVLWLLPLAVLSRVRWLPLVAVEITNAAVWLLFAPVIAFGRFAGDSTLLTASQVAAVLRTAALVWLVVDVTRRAEGAGGSEGSRVLPAYR